MAKRRGKVEKEYITKEERIELGLCLYCNSKAMQSKKLCEEHYKIVLNNLSKAHKNNSSHKWREDDKVRIKYYRIKKK